jgi:hypothetical protein
MSDRVCLNKVIPQAIMGGSCSAFLEERGVYTVLVGNLRERDHWVDPGVDLKIILRLISRNWDVGVWTVSSWLRIWTGGGHL